MLINMVIEVGFASWEVGIGNQGSGIRNQGKEIRDCIHSLFLNWNPKLKFWIPK